jgi:hypothetical protein
VRLAVLLCLATSLGACAHDEPFTPAAVVPTPARSGSPRRITFNPEGDHWPAFLRDGSGIGYSYHPLERRDRDRCLAFIPPGGGMIMREICRHGLRDADSLNAVTTHGVSAGGRVALMAESGSPRRLFPDYRALWLGHLDSGPLVKVLEFPYTTSGGQFHLSAADFAWPDENTLVYLAMYWSYRPPSNFIPPDTEYTGIELVQLHLSGDSVASFTVLPGTQGASSLTPGRGDTVYFTMGGDSRVFSLATTTGQVGTLYDFGALGIARDARVESGTLTAIVGGRVHWYFRPSWSLQAQADSGGPIYAVHLPNGGPQLIADISTSPAPGTPTYRHLALDPAGRQLVAERSVLVVRVFPTFTDTVVSKESDLWLFDVP